MINPMITFFSMSLVSIKRIGTAAPAYNRNSGDCRHLNLACQRCPDYLLDMNQNSTPRKRPRILTVVFLALAGLIAITLGGFVLWCLFPSQPTAVALAAMASDDTVNVSDSGWLEFSPRQSTSVTNGTASLDENSTQLSETPDANQSAMPASQDKSIGVILYPGMHIDRRAYAPLARELAKAGYLTVVVSMPLNMALLNPDAARTVMAAYPSVRHWVIGGHSQGATMAAEYVIHSVGPDGSHNQDNKISGLLIWGSFVISDLSGIKNLPVLAINADHDGNCPPATFAASKLKLPPATHFETVKGGNHAQFGSYGAQFGDNPATISPEDQRRQVVGWTLLFLESLGK